MNDPQSSELLNEVGDLFTDIVLDIKWAVGQLRIATGDPASDSESDDIESLPGELAALIDAYRGGLIYFAPESQRRLIRRNTNAGRHRGDLSPEQRDHVLDVIDEAIAKGMPALEADRWAIAALAAGHFPGIVGAFKYEEASLNRARTRRKSGK